MDKLPPHQASKNKHLFMDVRCDFRLSHAPILCARLSGDITLGQGSSFSAGEPGGEKKERAGKKECKPGEKELDNGNREQGRERERERERALGLWAKSVKTQSV